MITALLHKAAGLLRPVPDFPKPGILFWDIAPILRNHLVFTHLVEQIAHRWKDANVHVVAGFDARGFIFGQAVAQEIGVGFEQIRKKGKLPGATKSKAYALEYGTAEVEMIDDGHLNGARVLLIDDLLATGGTARAGVELVEALGGTVVGLSFITELPELEGRAKLLDYPVHSLITVMEAQALVGVEYCVDMLVTDQDVEKLLLVRREDGLGVVMPGGRIEHESVRVAGYRELEEETGCRVKEGTLTYAGVLTGITRDPRGPKVSVVLRAEADTSLARGEPGKTSVLRVSHPEALPENEEFAFGHGPFVRTHWRVAEPELV